MFMNITSPAIVVQIDQIMAEFGYHQSAPQASWKGCSTVTINPELRKYTFGPIIKGVPHFENIEHLRSYLETAKYSSPNEVLKSWKKGERLQFATDRTAWADLTPETPISVFELENVTFRKKPALQFGNILLTNRVTETPKDGDILYAVESGVVKIRFSVGFVPHESAFKNGMLHHTKAGAQAHLNEIHRMSRGE